MFYIKCLSFLCFTIIDNSYETTTLGVVIFTTVVCGGLTEKVLTKLGMKRNETLQTEAEVSKENSKENLGGVHMWWKKTDTQILKVHSHTPLIPLSLCLTCYLSFISPSRSWEGSQELLRTIKKISKGGISVWSVALLFGSLVTIPSLTL